MITSTDNAKIKWVRSLNSSARKRRESRAFAVEGVRLAEEALAAGWEATLVIYTADLSGRGHAVVDAFTARGAQVEEVSPGVMRAASDTQTPQGILALIAARSLPLPERPGFVFILDEVRDPGNLGTMLRTAWAAGVDGVLLAPGGADLTSPKVVRAAMGAHFHVPARNMSWEEIAEEVSQAGLHVYLSAAGAGEVYYRADFRRPLAIIVGGEAHGAGEDARRLANGSVRIPMPGGGESLNAAAATAVLLFEVVRQRQMPD